MKVNIDGIFVIPIHQSNNSRKHELYITLTTDHELMLSQRDNKVIWNECYGCREDHRCLTLLTTKRYSQLCCLLLSQ